MIEDFINGFLFLVREDLGGVEFFGVLIFVQIILFVSGATLRAAYWLIKPIFKGTTFDPKTKGD